MKSVEKVTTILFIALIAGIMAFAVYSLIDNFRRAEVCESNGGVMVRGHLRYVCIDAGAVKK